MCCEHCVNRREFLTRAAGVTGVAALVAACGDGQVSGVPTQLGGGGGGPGTGGNAPLVIKVSDFPGLATTGFLVQVSVIVAAKRTGATTFDAFDMTCTHQGCITTITSGQRFDCPCHGSAFNSAGAVVSPPARDPLTKYPTSYDQATDKLTIG